MVLLHSQIQNPSSSQTIHKQEINSNNRGMIILLFNKFYSFSSFSQATDKMVRMEALELKIYNLVLNYLFMLD